MSRDSGGDEDGPYRKISVFDGGFALETNGIGQRQIFKDGKSITAPWISESQLVVQFINLWKQHNGTT